jgi:integrase
MSNQPKLTNKSITLASPGRHHAGVKGLYLYVSADGLVRRWIYRFTSPSTLRVTETGFGATVLPLADARKKAEELQRQIANGVCPIHAKRTERQTGITFKETCEQWIATHQSSWKDDSRGHGGSQMRNCRLLLFTHGRPLLDKPVASITPDMVEAALKGLWSRTPLQGRHALDMFARVLDYARAKGMRSGDNPASWRGMHEYRFARVKKTDRGHYAAMPYEGIPAFMQELRHRQGRGVGSVALEFAILTAARTSEVLGMTWSEIDFDKSIWTVPKGRMKMGREHEVPLSKRAMEILRMQQQHSSGSGFVFEGYGRTRMEERTLRSILKRMNLNVTVHGFRSTFRDWCGDTQAFAREHVEACLAHRVGNSVEQAYRRSSALEKRRVILDTWSSYCEDSAT